MYREVLVKFDIIKVKGAIFDVDGTLIDSMNSWFTVGVRYLKTLGIEADKNLGLTLFSMTMTEAAQYMMDKFDLMNVKEFRERLVSKLGDHANIDEIAVFFGEEMAESMRPFYKEEAVPRRGALELLEAFDRAGIPMTIATSTHSDLLEPALERLGMAKYFKKLISASALAISKSTPVPFDLCLDAMGLEAGPDIWVFEDGLYAIETVKKMGLSTVGIYDEISKGDWEKMKKISDVHVKELDELIEG